MSVAPPARAHASIAAITFGDQDQFPGCAHA